jgi:hypothetical protein
LRTRKSTVFFPLGSKIFDICQQKQLKLPAFCSTAGSNNCQKNLKNLNLPLWGNFWCWNRSSSRFYLNSYGSARKFRFVPGNSNYLKIPQNT